MPSDWDTWTCEREDERLALILVDLGWAQEATRSSRPVVACVELEVPETDDRGWPTENAARRMAPVEDDLTQGLESALSARLVARVSHAGKRELIFYLKDREALQPAVERILSKHPDAGWELYSGSDPEWTMYDQALYPKALGLRSILTRRASEALKAKGDPLTRSRPVRHWIRLRDPRKRERLVKELQSAGYEVDPVDTTNPATLSFVKPAIPDYELIFPSIANLMRLAERHDSDYDGWEAPVVTS